MSNLTRPLFVNGRPTKHLQGFSHNTQSMLKQTDFSTFLSCFISMSLKLCSLIRMSSLCSIIVQGTTHSGSIFRINEQTSLQMDLSLMQQQSVYRICGRQNCIRSDVSFFHFCTFLFYQCKINFIRCSVIESLLINPSQV
jgi:hypothetical protein